MTVFRNMFVITLKTSEIGEFDSFMKDLNANVSVTETSRSECSYLVTCRDDESKLLLLLKYKLDR